MISSLTDTSHTIFVINTIIFNPQYSHSKSTLPYSYRVHDSNVPTFRVGHVPRPKSSVDTSVKDADLFMGMVLRGMYRAYVMGRFFITAGSHVQRHGRALNSTSTLHSVSESCLLSTTRPVQLHRLLLRAHSYPTEEGLLCGIKRFMAHNYHPLVCGAD